MLTDKIPIKENQKSASFEKLFNERFQQGLGELRNLYNRVYAAHPGNAKGFDQLLETITSAFINRSEKLKQRDNEKLKTEPEHWFLSNQITGMSLYVDRFSKDLKGLNDKLDYLDKLGVNFLHLMPVFESPAGESDGGYAVSDFRKVDKRFGTLDDLKMLQNEMQHRNMYLMLDIVLNHTSQQHEWALKAKAGDKQYQDYFYFYDDRRIPDEYEKSMPEIFPESSPGNFTYVPACNKWVMTVFHNYQWDLNFTNPRVFVEMMDTIFFYANLGVDILRIDAPAFIWKLIGTGCQNLPMAHTLLQMIKQCVQMATPGMALLGEAIVAPDEIMKYFGTGDKEAQECDFAYNATHMALQWDALATGDTRVMLAAQNELLKKPYDTSWITYTRCHDDIGLGYENYMIEAAGYNPYEHRRFLMNYYSGNFESSLAKGALFSVNEKTGDARISGSLASLCGLEAAIEKNDNTATQLAVRKILLMQAHSFSIGGIPVIFYGDEAGYTNDYSYLQDDSKSYDNRWMHRPLIDWERNKQIEVKGTPEQIIFSSTQKLIAIRKKLSVIADRKNITWLTPHNIHVAGYLRAWDDDRVYCLFNFSDKEQHLTWYAFKEHGMKPLKLYDHWQEKKYTIKDDHEYFTLPPYSFFILEPK
ncbi:MAG: alpha-glucosidase C-terminal domain-containing protein [Chitinophagaceae bacterium]|nr:alpha-glucosidase C-terminal domain-containing protein [Chitinophagaceae bacterium]